MKVIRDQAPKTSLMPSKILNKKTKNFEYTSLSNIPKLSYLNDIIKKRGTK